MTKKITLEDLKRAKPDLSPEQEEVSEQIQFNRMASARIEALTHDVVQLIGYVEAHRWANTLDLKL